MSQEHENRLQALEARANALEIRCDVAEGKAYAYERVIELLLQHSSPREHVFKRVNMHLEAAANASLSTQATDHKVRSLDTACERLASVMVESLEWQDK